MKVNIIDTAEQLNCLHIWELFIIQINSKKKKGGGAYSETDLSSSQTVPFLHKPHGETGYGQQPFFPGFHELLSHMMMDVETFDSAYFPDIISGLPETRVKKILHNLMMPNLQAHLITVKGFLFCFPLDL